MTRTPQSDKRTNELAYQPGFGKLSSTEALPGALPVGQNSPQRAPRGLYTEVLSGTAFTAPRAENLSTWMYRLRPSAMHAPYRRIDNALLRSGPFDEVETPLNRLRWDPFPIPEGPTDFLEGLLTLAGSGEPAAQTGIAAHLYRANRSMVSRYFFNADGEMMFVPQAGAIELATELGRLQVAPGEIAVLPRGVKFRVDLLEGSGTFYHRFFCVWNRNLARLFELTQVMHVVPHADVEFVQVEAALSHVTPVC